MFLSGFIKTATTLVTMTPEEYYEVVREKDPHIGANIGAVIGGIAGYRHGLKGKKVRIKAPKAALVGVALGGGTGAVTGHLLGKAIRAYQAKKVRRMADELNLRATPGRKV